ncbi:MAG: AraC family transcriptional regulator [Oscillospiraceae bacterium]|nr:AraC family transcriptional regulator [Oscillospiraceae bacterium]
MKTQDLENKLMSLSYREMYYKKCLLANQPCVRRYGLLPSFEFIEAINTFSSEMIDKYGFEENVFMGTGIFERKPIPNAETLSLVYSQGRNTFNTNNFISENMDMSVFRVPRYLECTEIFDTVNIFYVFNGTIKITIEGELFSVEEGNILIVSPYIMQHLLIDDDSTVILALMIRSFSFAKSFYNIMECSNGCSDYFRKMLFDKENAPFSLVKSPYDENLKNLLLRIMILQKEEASLRSLLIRNLIESFLLHIFSQYTDLMMNYFTNTKTNELASRILCFIHENYSQITLDDVSKEFSYSNAHISRILYQRLGKKFKEIVTEIRLNKAQELLITSNLKIDDISDIIGYSDTRLLRYSFSKAYGISPSIYRNRRTRHAKNQRIM